MRVLLIASAAMAAVVATPAFAGAGQVDASYGAISWDADAWNGDGYQTSLGGAFAAPIGGGWNLQFDARANSVGAYDGEVVENVGSHAAVHAFRRTDSYAVGGFAGQTSYSEDAGMFAGVEGQAYLGDLTLSGSTGYGHFQRWERTASGTARRRRPGTSPATSR